MTNIICVLYNDPVSARSVVAVEDDAALAELKGSRLAQQAGGVYDDPRMRVVRSSPGANRARAEGAVMRRRS